ncbi:hypothetical protein KR054_000256 [Drosophila jambulina]|nr:hypothetical protein KR054_000256 [Drosophila jambulina]
MRLGCSWLVYLYLCLYMILHGDLLQATNILGVFPYCQSYPFQMVRPLVRALIERGHSVTIISAVGIPPDIEGVRHIRVAMLYQHMNEMIDSDQWVDFFRSKWTEGKIASEMLYNISKAILSDDGVQRMLQDKSEHFDMVMIDASHLDALYGLAEYYNASLMGLSCVRRNWNLEELAGNLAPSIFDPISPVGYSTDHSLFSMIYNWMFITEEKMLESIVLRPAQLRLFKKYFGYSTQKFEDLRARFSVILINTHFSMGRVRANVPNLIEVGGMHLSEAPEPCDAELQKFMDEAKHGVIYFSMGLDILVQYLPDNMHQPLLQAFSQVKQRIVWKNELSSTANKTDKMYALDKAPQRHILAHPNVRLFITQGGLLSVMEAIDSGVPMLGLPLFYDHFTNMHQAKLSGIAEVLDSNSLDADTLTNTIQELIENSNYALRAKEMSKTFRDRPMSPLDTAIWWTEYALRNRDVAHMRLNVEEIPLIRYYGLDSALSLFLRLGFVAGTIIVLSYRLYHKYLNRQRRLAERERIFLQIRMPLDWYDTAS